MKRWNAITNREEEIYAADDFIADLEAVCAKHGLTIGHEDHHGAFVIESLSDINKDWLRRAVWNATRKG